MLLPLPILTGSLLLMCLKKGFSCSFNTFFFFPKLFVRLSCTFFSVFSLLLFEPHLDNFYKILLIFSLICYLAISFLACHVIIHPHLSLFFFCDFYVSSRPPIQCLISHCLHISFWWFSLLPPICLIPLFKFLGVFSSCRYLGHY